MLEERLTPTIADRMRSIVNRIENALEALPVNGAHLYLDQIEERVWNRHKSGTHISATIDQAAQGRRTDLYNQAYLAALPAVVTGIRGRGEAANAQMVTRLAHEIAKESMEYLK